MGEALSANGQREIETPLIRLVMSLGLPILKHRSMAV